MPNVTRAFLLDLIERVVWTFAQTFFGGLAALFTGSALDVHSLNSLSGVAKVLAPTFAAAVAASLSAAKGLLAGLHTGTASTSITVAATAVTPGAHAVDTTPPFVPDLDFSDVAPQPQPA